MSETDFEVVLDSDFGKEIGFTNDKFEGYLWKVGNYVYISFIISKNPNKGNLKELFERISCHSLGIKVPTPFERMKQICQKNGFHKTREYSEEMNDWIEVWVKETKQ